jgi:hypothetical protein
MSPLAKDIIEKLNKEEDMGVLAEVLDFYEYLRNKKNRESKNKWLNIDEDEPTEDENQLYQQYKKSEEKFIPLEEMIRELNLDGK